MNSSVPQINPGWPYLEPGPIGRPIFVMDENHQAYYNLSIDDFSSLVTFGASDVEGSDWSTWSTYRQDEIGEGVGAKPNNTEKTWGADTYMRTETVNATVKLEFWGSELYLFGDRGPAYGAYSLQLDDAEATIHTAYGNETVTDPSGQFMHALRDLKEGRHELTIRTIGSRPDTAGEGKGFLFDYAVAQQRAGRSEDPLGPSVGRVYDPDLRKLVKNGTWNPVTIKDPDTLLERYSLETTDDLASMSYTFSGHAVQVYGGRSASHGAYRATLTDITNDRTVYEKLYTARAPACDQNSVGRLCKNTATLKFAVADLDPSVYHSLTLQNIHQGSANVFEVDLIRVIHNATATGPVPDEAGGAGALSGANPIAGVFALFMTFMALWRAVRH